MINFSRTFEEIKDRIALSCEDGIDARSLIFAADNAMRNQVRAVSCDSDSVNMLWTWLEKSGIQIFARIRAEGGGQHAAKIAAALHEAFRKGAAAAQLIAHPNALGELSAALRPIAADLFFGRDLILTVDLDEVQPDDWSGLFHNIKMTNAAGLGVLAGKGENTSGALYGMLDSMDSEFYGALQIISKDSDMKPVEDVWRLAQKMRPDAAQRLQFFIACGQ